MKKTLIVAMMLVAGVALALAGCEDKAKAPDAAAPADTAAAAPAAAPAAAGDEAELKKEFTKEAAATINEDNAMAEAEALEKEIDADTGE